MWKNEKIANLEKTSDKILAIIEEKPKSQKEIFNQLRPCLDKEKQNIRWKVIHDHLKRLVHSRKIGYFGNKVNKLHTKILLREKY